MQSLISLTTGKTCAKCSTNFEVSKDELAMLSDVSPVFGGRKFDFPLPTLCPQCRLQRRIQHRNERSLYHRKSDHSGQQIISMYAPGKKMIVYSQEEWWSDVWDGCEYGRELDFSKSFTHQMLILKQIVPHAALFTKNVENSTYTNFTLNLRNCYLLFGGGKSEDCLFGKFLHGCKNTLDALTLYQCELCYEAIGCERCYNCQFALLS